VQTLVTMNLPNGKKFETYVPDDISDENLLDLLPTKAQVLQMLWDSIQDAQFVQSVGSAVREVLEKSRAGKVAKCVITGR
jgi:hypothetical protein